MTRPLLSDTLDVDLMAARILSCWSTATDDQRMFGAVWYGDVLAWAEELAGDTGHNVVVVVAVVAALSPRRSWADNKADAEVLLRGGQKRRGVMRSNLARAQRVLQSDHPLGVLASGPKMYAFACNILGWTNHVTVDVWAARAALGSDDKSHVARTLNWVGAYERIADAYRKAAAEVGVDACVLQATVWVVVRGRPD